MTWKSRNVASIKTQWSFIALLIEMGTYKRLEFIKRVGGKGYT